MLAVVMRGGMCLFNLFVLFCVEHSHIIPYSDTSYSTMGRFLNSSYVFKAAMSAKDRDLEERLAGKDWDAVRRAASTIDELRASLEMRYGACDYDSAEMTRQWRDSRTWRDL